MMRRTKNIQGPKPPLQQDVRHFDFSAILALSMLCSLIKPQAYFLGLGLQFPIYKLLTHVEGVTLNTSMHQHCVISIASPTGHRKSDKHQLIYMTGFRLFSTHHQHYNMTDNKWATCLLFHSFVYFTINLIRQGRITCKSLPWNSMHTVLSQQLLTPVYSGSILVCKINKLYILIFIY